MSGCLSYIDIVSGTLYTIYCHWLCDIWVMISKFYGWKWIVPMDHGYRVHLPCRIASKFTCWKRSNAVDHCCDFSKPQPAKGSVDSWRVGGYVWKPISNALIWVDVLILLEMICKTTNVRDKMVRIIKQIETLHIFLVNFLLLYILICLGSTMFESKGWRKGLWAPLHLGCFFNITLEST